MAEGVGRVLLVACVGVSTLVFAYHRWAPSTVADPVSSGLSARLPAPTTSTAAVEPPATTAPTTDAVPLDDLSLAAAMREARLQYHWPTRPDLVSPAGACRANLAFDAGTTDRFYVGEQSCAEDVLVPALLDGEREGIDAAVRAIDWGFARMAGDGSFPGLTDAFHSTSLFLVSAARTSLLIEASPFAAEYAGVTTRWHQSLLRAARYLTRPVVLREGRERDSPYGHRRFLLGAALGLTGAATGDEVLRDLAREAIDEGVALQREDGVLAELGRHDSHYQAYAVMFALLWLQYDQRAPGGPATVDFIDRSVGWLTTRVLPTGEVLEHGNSRTAGQEINRDGSEKVVVLTFVVRALGGWGLQIGDDEMTTTAARVLAVRNGEPVDVEVPPERAASTWQGGPRHDGAAGTLMGPAPIVGWITDLGREAQLGYPVVAGDRVLVTVGRPGEQASVRLVALQRRTGEVVWEQQLGIGRRAPTDRAVLAFGDGQVLAATSTGDLQTFDAVTGEPGWSKRTGIEVTAPPSSSDGLFVVTGVATPTGPPSTYGVGPGVWAFRTSGSLAWQYHDPVLGGRQVAVAERRVFTVGDGGVVVSLDLATGSVEWHEDVAGRAEFGKAAALAWSASNVWITDGAGRTLVFDGASGELRRSILAGTDVAPVMSERTVWLFVAPTSTSWELQALEMSSDRADRSWVLPAPPAGPPLVVDGAVHVVTRGVDGGPPTLCAYPITGPAPPACQALPVADAESPGLAAAGHSLVVPLGGTVVSLA